MSRSPAALSVSPTYQICQSTHCNVWGFSILILYKPNSTTYLEATGQQPTQYPLSLEQSAVWGSAIMKPTSSRSLSFSASYKQRSSSFNYLQSTSKYLASISTSATFSTSTCLWRKVGQLIESTVLWQRSSLNTQQVSKRSYSLP